MIQVFDRLQNMMSGLGTSKDKRGALRYLAPIVNPADLVNAYRGDWLARKIVDIPAFDMTRAGRNWQAKEDEIEAIEAEERRLRLTPKLVQALKWARLFGGSAIILGARNGTPAQPLNPDTVRQGGLEYVHVLTRYQISCGPLEMDPASPMFGEPTKYTLTGRGRSVEIHPSRVVRLNGSEVVPFAGIEDGWGDSVLIAVMEAVENAGLTQSSIAALVQEAKVDVFKVPNLAEIAKSPERTKGFLARWELANEAKSIHNSLIVDKDEEWDQKTVTFNHLPEIARLYLQVAAGAADIPATRLLGQAPEGMNATGESDTRNYFDRLSAEQEMILRPALERIDEVLIRSALGSRPAEIHWRFAPLWQLSEKERAEVFKLRAEGARSIAGTGGMSPALMPIEALSEALVNAYVEDGTLPGLEAAIEKYGSLAEQDDDGESEALAITPDPQRLAANDAKPRSLYVRRDVANAAEILAWAKAQGFETTLAADDLHVTLLYSRRHVDWMRMGESWNSDPKGNLTVPAGGPRLVEPLGDKGAIVLLFNSTELQWRHRNMVEAGASHDYDEYQPHVTITYAKPDGLDLASVEPYRGKIVLGPEVFEELDESWSSDLREVGRGR